MRTTRLHSILLAATVTAVLGATTPAAAATPAVTAQAQAANAAFLAYAPPPAGGAGALCLVDTGVNVNPDTQPGLVSSSAVDGGSGNDVDPDGHGTTMAMIAGAVGHGMIGAWPQIKIVSVRATTTPTPRQEPTFGFNDYTDGMNKCSTLASEYHIHAIALALSSTIPPSPDQAQSFANAVGVAQGQNVAVLAAAGNQPGAVEEPAAEPGVFAVGASTAQSDALSPGAIGSRCNFSATQGLTFFAPGCGIDEADPVTDEPTCCGNGTSQASVFAAAVLVALMSYDPTLTYTKAEQLLVSTATDGNLNVVAAFEADGLGAIVAQGTANIPKAPAPTAASKPAAPHLSVQLARWDHGVLTLTVSGLAGNELSLELEYPHSRPRHLSTMNTTVTIRTARPRLVLLRVMMGNKQLQGPIRVHPT
ncbi:MAG: S8/S53 family peptidase [Solirubrobacteraceae bacterium]